MRLKRLFRIAALTAATGIGGGLLYLHFFPLGQVPDTGFDTRIRVPAHQTDRPIVLYDDGHHNAHTSDNLFRPFVELMRSDGYDIRSVTSAFTPENLASANLLVTVNAAGGPRPKLYGINLPFPRGMARESDAYTPEEIAAVTAWVERGGSLLIVADHFPFGTAMARLGEAFGIHMSQGFTELPHQYPEQPEPTQILFTRDNSLLADHPIMSGRSNYERIDRVMLFTGQSFDAPDAAPLLQLPDSAIDYVPPPPSFTAQPARALMGCAREFGMGRIVVLADAGMLTAQVGANGERFGMTTAGVCNRQFALNIMHWLSRLI